MYNLAPLATWLGFVIAGLAICGGLFVFHRAAPALEDDSSQAAFAGAMAAMIAAGTAVCLVVICRQWLAQWVIAAAFYVALWCKGG